MRKDILNWFIIIIFLHKIHGHGRMEDPPARNAAWRYGFDVPVNYDDVGLNCGGLSIQKANDGKCGVCGDSYSGPRDHEIGGKYATNIIVRSYVSGSLIDVKILLTANHVGFMELRLCPSGDPNNEVTQDCLDQHLLYIEGFGTQYPVNEGIDSVFLRAHLPDSLSCSHCVLQWRYHAGNSWGVDEHTGKSCLGCGHQEEFYNCADITIVSKDNDLSLPLLDSATPPPPPPPPISTTHGPVYVYPFVDPVIFPSEIEHIPIFDSPSTTTIESSTTPLPPPPPTTTEAMNYIYEFPPSDELMDQLHKNNKTIRCYPTNEVLKPLIGIENWCLQLCAIHCPPTLCACVQI